MSVAFTSEEIARAHRLVKLAGTRPPNIDAAIQSLMGPGSYDAWLGPRSRIDPTPPPRSGFFKSLGRSALGAVDSVAAPFRGFLGLAPGVAGWRTTSDAATGWARSKLMGNQSEADRYGRMFRGGLMTPWENARKQSRPYHYALANWANVQHPGTTDVLTHPFRSVKNFAFSSPPEQRIIEQPLPDWWQK